VELFCLAYSCSMLSTCRLSVNSYSFQGE
jgi:hypothetical protein